MSSFTDEEYIQRCFIAKDEVKPENLGRGPAAIRGSAYLQGPTVIGKADAHKNITSTLMLAPLQNSDSLPPFVSGSI